jgi:hypothetical protein
MFRIRSEQMRRLGESTRARFVAMMHDYLREYFPAWVATLSDDELSSWLGAALDKADGYGVRTEPEAAQLILLLVVLGLDADETAEWAREVLGDEELVAVGKVRKLARLAKERGVAGIEHALVYPEMEG